MVRTIRMAGLVLFALPLLAPGSLLFAVPPPAAGSLELLALMWITGLVSEAPLLLDEPSSPSQQHTDYLLYYNYEFTVYFYSFLFVALARKE